LAGLLVGGFPVWAARRILYPPWAEELPDSEDMGLDFEDGVVAERVEFESVAGHRLSGWFVPGPEGSAKPWRTVLLVYGYGGYKEQMVAYARIVRAGGFATLMFDMQGSGLRRGEPVTLGFKERWDVMGAARYLQSRPDVDPEAIGVFGVSMGAATAILAAAEEPAIKAIVSDSGYADVEGMIRPGLAAFIGRFSYPFAPLIVRIAEAMIGAKAAEIVPERAAAELGDRPLLVIHGADDALVSPESAQRLYDAASGPKELWVVPDCEHGQGPAVAPEEYQAQVNGFLARWLTREPTHELVTTQVAAT
jgi:fermentation-respiration switch protein FrsA (DUF1100 family)